MKETDFKKKGLFRLSELKDYEVSKSDPDVRGWNVYSSDKKTIGVIDELIVDPELMKVRYLDLFLNEDINREIDTNRHLLIPIGSAEIDEKNKTVYLTEIETITLLKMPGYEGGIISRDYESKVRSSLRPNEKISDYNTDFYNNDLFDENRFYKSRNQRLYGLKEIEPSKVLGNHPDIRGWAVFTSDGINIGKVFELLIDKENNKVRYLDIKIDKESVFNAERHILIPIGMAELGINGDKVLIDIPSKNFSNYPVYTGEVITHEYETSLINSITSTNEHQDFNKDKKNYTRHQYYDDEGFFKKNE